MRTNADITVYNKYIDPTTRTPMYQRTQLTKVAWEDRKGANVIRSGLLQADQATIFIPYLAHCTTHLDPKAWLAAKSGKWTLQSGDIVVKGLVSDEIHAAVVSPPSAAFTVSDLEAKYDNVLLITSVDPMLSGSQSMWHWKVGAS
jgi:hypothetical protein